MNGHGKVKDEVREELLKHLPRGFGHKGEECFGELFGITIGPASGPGSNYEARKKFLFACIKLIGRCAQKSAGDRSITWTDLAKAANCMIPVLAEICVTEGDEKERRIRGEFCKDFKEIPEEPPV